MGSGKGAGAHLVVTSSTLCVWIALLGAPPQASGEVLAPRAGTPPSVVPPSAVESPAGSELVRCPDCDSEGKVACPTCGGKGELMKPCPACKGTGKKACPVCVKDDGTPEGNRTPPGRVPCDSCGGRGVLRSGKTCPHCDGGQTIACTSCGAKGWISCPKTVYDKVCPDCKFVRRITCPICGGKQLVEPSVLEAKRREAARARSSSAASASTVDATGPHRPNADASGSEISAASSAPSTAELERRYEELREAYLSNLDIFGSNPLKRLESLRVDAARFSRELPPLKGVEDSPGSEVASFAARLDRFRRRWNSLESLFLQAHRSYGLLQTAWNGRGEKLEASPKGRRDEVEAELNMRSAILASNLERHLQRLATEEPSWLLREVAEIERAWPTLKEHAEKSIEASQRAREEAKALALRTKEENRKAREAARRSSKMVASAKSAASRPQAPGPAGSKAPPPNANTGSDDPTELEAASEPPDELDVDAENLKAASSAAAPRAAPLAAPAPADSSSSSKIGGAILIAGAAAMILLVFIVWRRGVQDARAQAEDRRPPAVS